MKTLRHHDGDRSARALIVAVVVATTLLASCGLDTDAVIGAGGSAGPATTVAPTTEDGAEDPTTTTTEPADPDPTTTTEPEDEPPGDPQARASSIDLGPSDVPDGWRLDPHDAAADGSAVWEKCADLVLDDLTLASHATDDLVFGDPMGNDGQQISVVTRVFESEATAQLILAFLDQPEFVACNEQDLRRELAGLEMDGGLAPGSFSLGGVDGVASFDGDFVVTNPSTGESLDLSVALVTLRTGDLVTGISGLAVGQEAATEEFRQVLDRVVELHSAL